jgi:anti-sigma factor (TIGR02949 family)
MPSCCKECVDFLAEYLDGDLPEKEAADFQAHLDACPPCVAFVDTYRKTTIICREKLAVSMPAELSAAIMSFLRERIRE